jgi:hypothetical protein
MNAEDAGFETMLLEKTLKKIGGLLQVGFGSAGAEIIGNNMGAEGEMNAMVPGKLITSVFGFCIIEDFTETCSYLGADITRYINTVAAIAHGNVSTRRNPSRYAQLSGNTCSHSCPLLFFSVFPSMCSIYYFDRCIVILVPPTKTLVVPF